MDMMSDVERTEHVRIAADHEEARLFAELEEQERVRLEAVEKVHK